MESPLKVVLFADSFEEANGVATVSREFAAFAKEHELPFCCVRAGPKRQIGAHGSVTTLELDRSRASFPLDRDLHCDPFLSRHKNWVMDRMQEFRPDLIHITGPGDFGVLGFWVSHELGIPLAASWHTNLHQYASQRVQSVLKLLPCGVRQRIGSLAEELSLNAAMRFYRLAHFVLAPNQEMVDELARRTQRPAYLMAHGVDTRRFSPAPGKCAGKLLSIGYVGRLTPEKNVRWFRELERTLVAEGAPSFHLVLVGDGSERAWLSENLEFGELPGVLREDKLAAAFAEMDIFVFPSYTDTFGLVILEAMASGVPVIVTPSDRRWRADTEWNRRVHDGGSWRTRVVPDAERNRAARYGRGSSPDRLFPKLVRGFRGVVFDLCNRPRKRGRSAEDQKPDPGLPAG